MAVLVHGAIAGLTQDQVSALTSAIGGVVLVAVGAFDQQRHRPARDSDMAALSTTHLGRPDRHVLPPWRRPGGGAEQQQMIGLSSSQDPRLDLDPGRDPVDVAAGRLVLRPIWAAFSASGIARLTANQLAGLDSTQLSALTASEVNSFSATQLGELRHARCRRLSATPGRRLSSSVIGALSMYREIGAP